MNLKRILIAFLLLIPSLELKATFQDATELYDNQSYQQAFTEFEKLAKIGHKSSQFNLGVMYLEGTGVKQDLVKAYAWVKLSDEDANKEVDFLEEIKGYISDKEQLARAEDHFNFLKAKYGTEAIVEKYKPEINDVNITEVNNIKPLKNTNPDYPITAQLKGIEGLVTLNLHVSPSGYPTDIRVEDAVQERYFKRVALKAVRKWMFTPNESDFPHVFKYRMGFQLGSPKRERLVSLKEKAIDGDAKSQYLYGKYGSFGVPYDENGHRPFNSNSWYFEAASNGVVNAQHAVADNLIEGKGCEADPKKGIAWLTIAASAGYEPSMFYLAKLSFDKGNGEQGTEWLTQAFETDDPILSYKLVSYVFDNDIQGINPKTLLKHLQSVLNSGVKNPVRTYYYLARAYELAGNLDEAIDYQEEAIEELEDLGETKIPVEFTSYLSKLKKKVS